MEITRSSALASFKLLSKFRDSLNSGYISGNVCVFLETFGLFVSILSDGKYNFNFESFISN